MTLIKSTLHSNKQKIRYKTEMNGAEPYPYLPPNLQTFKQIFLSRIVFFCI